MDRSTCVNKNIDRPSVHTGITCHIAWTCVTSNLHTFFILKGVMKDPYIQAEDTDIQRLLHLYRRHAMKAHILPPTPPTYIYSTRKFQGYEERNRLACTSCATKTSAPLKKSLPSCALSRDNLRESPTPVILDQAQGGGPFRCEERVR